MVKVLLMSFVLLQGAAAPPAIVLENDQLRVVFDRQNGAVTGVFDKVGRQELIREPRLAGNFMFALPIPGKQKWETLEANYVVGAEQKLSQFEQEGQKLILHWDGPLMSVLGKAHVVRVTMGIELRGRSVLFTLHVDNPTNLEIGETYFPILGGLKGLGGSAGELKETALVIPSGNASVSVPIFTTFSNFSWLGAQGPEQFYSYPGNWAAPWLDLYQPKLNRSVFLAVRDDPKRAKVLHLELVPGSSGTTRWDGNWPRPEELKGQPVGVRLAFAEFSNVPAGKPWDASPVELQFHAGDWKDGQKVFQAGKGR